MRTHVTLMLCTLAIAALLVGCGKKDGASATPLDENGKPIAQKLCPVMGDPIDPKIYVDYNGRRIYFCCNACPPKFKADPEKYIKIVDEELKKAGVPVPAAIVYTCPMHPQVKQDKPGKCPICGMDLVQQKPEAPTAQ